MPVLTLAETLIIAAPERGRLVEADDAIRDLVSAIEEAVRRDGLDQRLVSRALVDLMIAAAARQALAAYPSVPRAELAEIFRRAGCRGFRMGVATRSGPGARQARLTGS